MLDPKKQLSPVLLPDEHWTSHWKVLRAISNAFYADRREAAGAQQIVRKVRLTVFGEVLQDLSEPERLLLEMLSGCLPTVHVDSSDSEWDEYVSAFKRLQPSLEWKPAKPVDLDLYVDYLEGSKLRELCLAEFRARVADGRLAAVDANGRQVRAIAPDSLLLRSDIEAYLAERRVAHAIASRPEVQFASSPPAAPLETLEWEDSPEFARKVAETDEPPSTETIPVALPGTPGVWADPKRVARLEELMARRPIPFRLIKEELGVGRTHAYRVLAEKRAEREASRRLSGTVRGLCGD
jgi:hypothetical protein